MSYSFVWKCNFEFEFLLKRISFKIFFITSNNKRSLKVMIITNTFSIYKISYFYFFKEFTSSKISFISKFHLFRNSISSNDLIVSAQKFRQKSFVALDELNNVWTEFSLNYWIIVFVWCFVIIYYWIVHLKAKLCWENLKWKK